ncbi:hypothetical protein V6N11_038660 [Hibiscus sabdariffa]|uniref:Uncharacterized protein n=1 Tax=Hibiscus sabdariffa TaxID=183260 RepID=A0ABR2SLA6_9ROSI
MGGSKWSFSCSLFTFLFLITGTSTQDIIFPGESIKDGETLVSAGGSFELGFFSPGSSKNRYVGIWYKKVSSGTVVWVANRETPVSDKSGVLSVTGQGIITLLNGKHSLVWSSNMSKAARSPVVQLLESGNLVVKERNDNNLERTLWESFDYPGDSFLPEMKIGRNFITGFERYLTSWKSTEDPAPGEYSIRIDPRGYPQFVLKKGSEVVFRGGSWNGLYFTVNPRLEQNSVFSYDFVLNSMGVYWEYKKQNSLCVSRLQLNPLGAMQHSVWNKRKHVWEILWTTLSERCATYAFCGPYATCTANKFPPCACLEGYVAKSITFGDPGSVDSSDGCVRMTPLNCDGKDRFFKHTRLKLPDTSHAWANNSMSLHEYRIQRKTKPKEKLKVAIISISSVVATGLLIPVFVLYVRKKKLRKKDEEKEEIELPMIVFKTVANATDNFSTNNLLGRGGFGAVYKGILEGGQEVAVKRLSKNSGQGLEEFKTEVTLIVKLQHRNLVKLLVSGKRNRGFSDSNHDHNLLGHAWSLWIADRPLELIDNALGGSYSVAEARRCINVALLCVQQQPEDRPDMPLVVMMLCGESSLAHPKQPGFFLERSQPQAESAVGKQESLDQSTITALEPR